MDCIMNENQLTIVEEKNFDNPLIDNSIRDCHHKYFHTFDHICEYNLNFTNTNNNEPVNFTTSDKGMGMYEFNKKITIARGNGFIFIQTIELTIKIYKYTLSPKVRFISIVSSIFRRISHNHDYIQTHCNNRENTFHFECRQCYSYNNPQCSMV